MVKFTKPSLQSILISSLVVVASTYALLTTLERQSLIRKNNNLVQQSENLQKSLDQILSSNHEFLRGLQSSEKEKKHLKSAFEGLKKENETLQFNFKKLESKIDSIKEEKSYLEEMLINKTKQIEILNTQKEAAPQVPALTQELQTLGTQVSQKDEDLQRLNEQNKILQQKMDRLYRMTNDKINEINVAKIALEETVSTARKKINDEWKTVDLGAVTSTAQATPPPSFVQAPSPLRQMEIQEEPVAVQPQQVPQEGSAKDEGHVLAINNEHGFVVIDLGKVNNLQSDATLQVVKNGVPVATLNVLEIRDVMAACNIRELESGQQIEINDAVTILR